MNIIELSKELKESQAIKTFQRNGKSSYKSPYYDESQYGPYNPSKLFQKKGMSIIDDMLKDEQVYAVVKLKQHMALSTGWHILPNETDTEDEIFMFVKENLEEYYKGCLSSDMEKILSAIPYGFSVSEKIFTLKDGKIMLSHLKTIPPHSIDFYTDDLGNLLKDGIRQKQNYQEVVLPKNKVLMFIHDMKFGNYYGTSDLERCYEPWFTKREILRFWNIYLERYAMPLPVGKLPTDQYNTEDAEDFETALKNIQSASSIIIPGNAELSFETSGGQGGKSTSDYKERVNYCNVQIARSVLVPEMLGYSGEIQGGSYNLSENIKELFYQIVGKIRNELEELINEDIIKQLVDLNFGEQEKYPFFEFKPFEDKDKKEFIKLWTEAVGKNIYKPNEDEINHFRNLIHFPEGEVKEADKPVNPILNPLDQKKQGEDKEPELEDKKEDDSEDPEDKEEKKEVELTLKRKARGFENKLDFKLIEKELEEPFKQIVSKCASIFEEAKNNIINKIVNKRLINTGTADVINRLKIDNLGEVKAKIANDFLRVYKAGVRSAREEIARDKNINKFAKETVILGTNVPLDEALEAAIKQIDLRTFQAVGAINDEIMNKVKNAIISGMQRGAPTREVIKEIEAIFNGVIETSVSEKLDANANLLETIIRTNYTTFYNLGRRAYFDSPKLQEYIKYYQYSAILDVRTTDICQDMDGKIITKSDIHLTPPLHFNCRSILIPITEYDLEDNPELKPDKLPNFEKYPEAEGFVYSKSDKL